MRTCKQSNQINDESSLINKVKHLTSICKDIHLSSIDYDFHPHSSVTHFVYYENSFYTFLCPHAEHTGNLINHPRTSFMLKVNEEHHIAPGNVKQISLKGTARTVDREEDLHDLIIDRYMFKYGNQYLSTLKESDFILFELIPLSPN
ncbi:pyridoxamine 5'-phosphate oxidase family protein [Vibrio barjaei]|uniref:pyridoxamine 5'-phosphate oxidase family protein n=1 Tax=Vibrio barjaei TaxID=1676683 RepID=UPI00228497F5|nr:pyridoxamine 5'-phosphate oxidase family protein [Vibrio barjaei]MCY9870364.1 pyridoxamine 5'-phosphate oxidase family protein [Vibrio barjaei]